MVKKIIVVFLVLTMVSCFNQYKFKMNKNGEPILDTNLYTLQQKIPSKAFKLIDTTALYLEISTKLNNPEILIFHNDGYFETTSKKYFRNFKRPKNSAYYGGKYFVEGKNILVEQFYPAMESSTKRYIKELSKGEISGDTIKLKIFNRTSKFVKKSYSILNK